MSIACLNFSFKMWSILLKIWIEACTKHYSLVGPDFPAVFNVQTPKKPMKPSVKSFKIVLLPCTTGWNRLLFSCSAYKIQNESTETVFESIFVIKNSTYFC